MITWVSDRTQIFWLPTHTPVLTLFTRIKVSKKEKIRNRYNQVPHLTQEATLENDKNTRKHHFQESQDSSPFPAGNHKAAMNRQDRHETYITKRIHKRSTPWNCQ